MDGGGVRPAPIQPAAAGGGAADRRARDTRGAELLRSMGLGKASTRPGNPVAELGAKKAISPPPMPVPFLGSQPRPSFLPCRGPGTLLGGNRRWPRLAVAMPCLAWFSCTGPPNCPAEASMADAQHGEGQQVLRPIHSRKMVKIEHCDEGDATSAGASAPRSGTIDRQQLDPTLAVVKAKEELDSF
ncbi:hypothetical protein ZWY2020_033929 [Hordeum vulgare]|nr:hypothetical protein ZWY2020_033929 [Hordeum vulgare]